MIARILFSVVMTVTPILVGHAVPAMLDDDGMLLVDGRRLFILGLYENPTDDAVLREAAAAGIKLVYAAASRESLDRLGSHGVYAWLNTGSHIDLSENADARGAGLKEMVERFADHPALLVWEVPDEALWNTWYNALLWRGGAEPKALAEQIAALEDATQRDQLSADLERSRALHREGCYAASEKLAEDLWRALGQNSPHPELGLANAPHRAGRLYQGMVKGRALLGELDPVHPVWMNHAPRNQVAQLARFNEAADIVGCDIYPVPESPHVRHSDLLDRTLASVGAYTRRMQQAAPGKPVWMVLQGFGWGDIQPERPPEIREQLRRPTLAETRFMAFDAIVHGARGILYWGTAYIEKDSTCWRDLLTVVKELDDLQPVITGHDVSHASVRVTIEETFGSHDEGVTVLPKRVENEWWLIVVNERSDPLTYMARFDLLGQSGSFRERYTGAVVDLQDSAFRHTIPGYGVQIFHRLSP